MEGHGRLKVIGRSVEGRGRWKALEGACLGARYDDGHGRSWQATVMEGHGRAHLGARHDDEASAIKRNQHSISMQSPWGTP